MTICFKTKPERTIFISFCGIVQLIISLCVCVSAQAARVIYEVPHVDSEVAEMDKHSTNSSRGSSQWVSIMVMGGGGPEEENRLIHSHIYSHFTERILHLRHIKIHLVRAILLVLFIL